MLSGHFLGPGFPLTFHHPKWGENPSAATEARWIHPQRWGWRLNPTAVTSGIFQGGENMGGYLLVAILTYL